jgi:hypothetical protein
MAARIEHLKCPNSVPIFLSGLSAVFENRDLLFRNEMELRTAADVSHPPLYDPDRFKEITLRLFLA